ncbi:hypothetical protein [Stenotrophomonas phage StenR_269]|nr:hypothetical protein [Stenotrophomonas phage StenR_269]
MAWWDTASSWASNISDAYSSSSSSSSGNGNIWGAVISGIGSAASGYMQGKNKEDTEKLIGLKGIEDRRNLDFAARLEDFNKQQEKQRKRASLNSYGQFNLMGDIMPTTTPAIDVPARPTI